MTTADEARQAIGRLAEKRVDAIKLVWDGTNIFAGGTAMPKLSRDTVRAAIEEANRRKLRVTVHLALEEDAIDVIQFGATGIEHSAGPKPLTDNRLANLLVTKKASYVPTMWVLIPLRANDEIVRNVHRKLKVLSDAGVRIVVGTDTFADSLPSLGESNSGLNTIIELELMAQAGMSSAKIIQAATCDAAEHLGLKDVGTVVAGKRADLLIVDGDPLQNISAVRKLRQVIQSGEIVVDTGPPH